MRRLMYLLLLAACGHDHASVDVDAEVVADTTPPDASPFTTPIKYVVVIVKENHTFDNYFTGFPGAESSMKATLHDGTVITRQKAADGMLAGDVSHSHDSAVKAYANGKMNGFDLLVTSDPRRPFVYYAESQIPNYWAYARNFALFDHFFSTLGGPSSPGHFATIAAQTPLYSNPACADGTTNCHTGCLAGTNPISVVPTYNPETCATSTAPSCFDVPTVVDALPPGVTWRAYGSGTGTAIDTPFKFIDHIGGDPAVRAAHFRPFTQMLGDIAAGDMANFTHIDVESGPNGITEHPPVGPCTGENWTVDLVNAIMQGPHWNETAIVITWDDWGGFYDHVAPTVEKCANGDWFNTGFRLPALVISPYAKKAVIKTVTEHASIPRLVEELFGAPWMTAVDPHARDEKAGSMLDAFDFTQAPRDPLILTKRATCP